MREAIIRVLLGAVGFAIVYLFILPSSGSTSQVDAPHILLYGLIYSALVSIVAKFLARKA